MRFSKVVAAFTLCCALALTGSGMALAQEGPEEELPPLEFDDIIDRGFIRIGVKTSVLGFSFQDPRTGEFKGMENSMGELIAKKLGVNVEFIPVTTANRIDMLNNEDIDLVIATFTVTPERAKILDFSTPYYVDNVTMLVQKDSPYKTLKDLQGAKISVCLGTTSPSSVVEALIDNKIISASHYDAQKFDPDKWTEYVSFAQFKDYPSAARALNEGKVQAFCVDRSIISFYLNDKLKYLEESFGPQEYAIASKKGRGLTPYLNKLLAQWMQDGTLDKLLKENHID